MNATDRIRPSRSGPAEGASSGTLLPDTPAALPLLVSLMLVAVAGVARAELNAYEPFDYTASIPDGAATTASGFDGVWICGTTPSIATGMTHPDLPTAHGSFSSSSGRQLETLETPLFSGTTWISFLFNQAGNNGANLCGVYLSNGGTGLFFGYGLAPFSPTQGGLGLGSMTTVGPGVQGASNLASSFLGTFGTAYLVAMKIEFDTAGANDTVTVYLNPTANAATPEVAATYTLNSFDVGTITGIGFQNQGGGFAINVDEIRVGDTYGDVVGYVGTPPDTPTGLGAASGSNSVSLTWSAATGNPTGYHVKRATNSGGPYFTVGSTTVPTVVYEDSVLGGQPYYYVVSALNAAGESSNSLPVSASPILAAPATPTALVASPGNAQVVLSWAASSFAASYTVKRADTWTGPYALLGTTTAPTVTYTDSNGLSNGATYHYVVSATGAGGTSPDTTPVSATPVGPMPLEAAIAPGAGITWFASNNVTYQVQWSSELLGTNTVWSNLGSLILGNGATNTVFDPVGPPHNVYRVLSIQ